MCPYLDVYTSDHNIIQYCHACDEDPQDYPGGIRGQTRALKGRSYPGTYFGCR